MTADPNDFQDFAARVELAKARLGEPHAEPWEIPPRLPRPIPEAEYEALAVAAWKRRRRPVAGPVDWGLLQIAAVLAVWAVFAALVIL